MTATKRWGEYHPGFNAIDQVLAEARSTDLPDVDAWRAGLVELLSQASAQSIRDRARELLAALPYNLIIEQARAAHHSRQAAVDLNDVRKTLLVIRDSLALTRDPAEDQSLDPLFDLCRALNLERKQPSSQRVARISRTCAQLCVAATSMEVEADSSWMQARIAAGTEHMTVLCAPSEALDPEAYHDLRKGFRSVAHLSIMASIDAAQPNLHLATEGAALSREFGHRKDALGATAQ